MENLESSSFWSKDSSGKKIINHKSKQYANVVVVVVVDSGRLQWDVRKRWEMNSIWRCKDLRKYFVIRCSRLNGFQFELCCSFSYGHWIRVLDYVFLSPLFHFSSTANFYSLQLKVDAHFHFSSDKPNSLIQFNSIQFSWVEFGWVWFGGIEMVILRYDSSTPTPATLIMHTNRAHQRSYQPQTYLYES